MDADLAGTLKRELCGWHRVAILGLGNELGGDDGLGLLAARRIRQILPTDIKEVEILETGVAPENFTGVLRKLQVSHVILIDSAEMGKRAGYIEIVNPDRIQEVLPSTHSLPLSVLAKYIEKEFGAKVIILGIQPKQISFSKEVSSEVRDSVEELAIVLKESLDKKPVCRREAAWSGFTSERMASTNW